MRFKATDLVHVETQRFARDVWKDNRRLAHFGKSPFTGFAVAQDYFTAEFLRTDGAYLGKTALGLDSQIGTIIRMPTGEIVVYAFDRWREAGLHGKDDVHAMNRLYPHLLRSGLIAARLGLEQAMAVTRTLQALGLPAAVLSASARVLATNPLLDALATLFMPAAFGRLAINDAAADALVRKVFDTSPEGRAGQVLSIPIARSADRPACVLHLIPLRRSAQDLFAGGDWLLAVTTLGKALAAPPAEMLMGLFDLTPAEARFAGALASGRTIREAACSVSITEKSGRTYLERIFAKTGTRRQSELLSLLRSAHPFT